MCGIVGIWQGNGATLDLSELRAATQQLHHRGPDDEGYLLVNTASKRVVHCGGRDSDPGLNLPQLEDFYGEAFDLALGFRRLAILDLSPAGHQPMSDAEGQLWIVFNGEIYNYLEIRAELVQCGHHFRSQCDTEVILHAYQEWGEACVQRFNGMWAFALVDLRRGRLFCSRDRLGVKPFHYVTSEPHFAFSSEIKALLPFSFVPKRLNEQVVYEYLAYGAVEYNQESFFAGVQKLLPGHQLCLDLHSGQLQLQRYYQPPTALNHDITHEEAAQEFRRLLTDSVRLRLRSDVPVGSCLSGGLDSSTIVCLMHELLQAQQQTAIQHTFSSHFEEAEANELVYMQAVIGATGVQPHFIYPTAAELVNRLEKLVWSQEEPFGSTSIFAQWSVFQLIHNAGIKVVLDGQGADETLGGYLPLLLHFYQELLRKRQYLLLLQERWQHNRRYGQPWTNLLPAGVRRLTQKLRGGEIKAAVPSFESWMAPALATRYAGQSDYEANQRQQPFGEDEIFNNVLYHLTFANHLPALLKYEDRNSMAFSVEARVPFLDYRLVEFAFSLPATVKIHNGYTKHVLRSAMVGVLPEKVRWRTGKLGFATPERSWQRTTLRPLAQMAAQDPALRPFLVPEQALRYLDRLDQHNLHTFVPWRWINLHLWMKVYGLQAGETV
jgi:asparagine synthase (glutamine-hydrolysing)